ncbi:aspartate/glutamate racemase family protein [Marinomonas sp. TW1]|uniref:aspartate/glutamate racemase family protein n=1 Tax=Marinomonas sp. TW1 TaxID=1561203 RepID=UPI0007AF75A7|nr:aspartate/glutamate racemase family protein [Marinomonas sp. TW1]KZN14729.1 aspartate racemase [Marinomonas sp. TW1]
MKTIGLLGGMSWESTASYYSALNQGIKNALGGLHSAKINMVSVDFAEIEQLQHAGDWQATAEILSQAALSVEASGADGLLICTNTMHKVADKIQAAIHIPVLHIADATGQLLQANGITKVGLLGTRFTMAEDFYKVRLTDQFAMQVMVPNESQQAIIHHVIYDELCRGEIRSVSRQQYLEIIDDLHQQGAQAVILGCTEIALLVKQTDTNVPLYDTTSIHAQRAVQWMLS